MSALDVQQDAISAALEAAVGLPNDGSGISYNEVDDFVEERSPADHRKFVWDMPSEQDLLSTHGHDVEWSVGMSVYVDRRNRTFKLWARAVADEIVFIEQTLIPVFAGLPGTAVIEGAVPDILDDSEDSEGVIAPVTARDIARIDFTFTFNVSEG